LNKRRHTALHTAGSAVVLAFLASQLCFADEYRQFPGAEMDSRTLKIQEKVEDIYSSGDYDRALLIYEKELAPLGDKYAQYMVGFMHLTGKGVDENPAEALAWYRLAAERDEVPFTKARDALREMLGPSDLERSDLVFSALWQRYSDRKLILDLIKEDLDILRRENGGPEAEPTAASLAAGYSGNETSEGYYRRVRARLTERLQYLGSTRDAEEAGIANAEDITTLEAEIRQELKALDIP
jgi:Sel1 repeat